jgi:hypothetical protein
MAPKTSLTESQVNVRIKISALWMSMLFVFAYVDLFSLYRPDFRADLQAGEVGGHAVSSAFLLGATAYIAIPAVMAFGTLILRPHIARYTNLGLSAVYAASISAGAIGEWSYYVAGSAIEVALLAAITYCAWTWPTHPGRPPLPEAPDVHVGVTS